MLLKHTDLTWGQVGVIWPFYPELPRGSKLEHFGPKLGNLLLSATSKKWHSCRRRWDGKIHQTVRNVFMRAHKSKPEVFHEILASVKPWSSFIILWMPIGHFVIVACFPIDRLCKSCSSWCRDQWIRMLCMAWSNVKPSSTDTGVQITLVRKLFTCIYSFAIRWRNIFSNACWFSNSPVILIRTCTLSVLVFWYSFRHQSLRLFTQ